MENQLVPPGPLQLDSSNLEQSWNFWSQQFDLYMTASGADQKPESTQFAIFLHLIGDDALQVCNTFTFASDDERSKLDVVRQKFADYCQPRHNIVYERYQFWRQTQAPGENIDTFVTSLCDKAKSCDFGSQEESMIRDHIVLTCPDQRLQERLLRDPDLTLARALTIYRAAESRKEQHHDVARTTSIDQVSAGRYMHLSLSSSS